MNTSAQLKPWLLFIFIFFLFGCEADHRAYKNSILKQRTQKYQEFLNPELSPLSTKDFSGFSGLHYFPVNPSYNLEATWNEQLVKINSSFESSKNRGRHYIHAGSISFTYQDSTYTLQAFLMDDTSTTLFIPFTDKTSGKQTYEAGRYMDLSLDSAEVYIDFNKAYNPYCAYNPEYDCPIPPLTNHLPFKVQAGEKKFKH